MAYKLMIQGTAKGAGKSFIVAGILRAFSELGFKVCPFKTVEVTTDTFVTKEGAEISKQMATLSFAASTEPSVYMNPIGLKPADEENFHVLVNGELKRNMTIPEFLDSRTELWDDIKRSIAELEKEYDIIIFEGDRSPAELDLKENDISLDILVGGPPFQGFSIAGPDVIRMLTPISCAIMPARVVFPSPGGPCSSTWSRDSVRRRAASIKMLRFSLAFA